MKGWLKEAGPGILVTAAFIGPGTVTVCTLAGVRFGFDLLWALLLSIVGCLVLQEMSARLGIVTGKGLSEVIRSQITRPVYRGISLILLFSAIVVGNAAYEAGNIAGAVLGVSAVFPSPEFHVGWFSMDIWSLVIGTGAFGILMIGKVKVLEKIFMVLVGLMGLAFLLTAILTRPDLTNLLRGLLIPSTDAAGLLTAMAFIGTTIVPYNLFLHASLVNEKWKDPGKLGVVRKELFWSILLGGAISMAIVITAAASGLQSVSSAADFAIGLEPLFGSYARWCIAAGLFAAGITSSITAPLAAAYVVKGCLGWKKGLHSGKFKAVWSFVLISGVMLSSLGLKPVDVIRFAQIANGILLPVVALFLFWIVNKVGIMGTYRNSVVQNISGVAVIALSLFLGIKAIISVWQEW